MPRPLRTPLPSPGRAPRRGAVARVASPTPAAPAATPPRSRRAGTPLYEDPLQFLWAISYSDLLMVLMTFFIIYFNYADTVLPTPISQVLVALDAKKITDPRISVQQGVAGNQVRRPRSAKMDALQGKLVLPGITTDTVGESRDLVVHFEGDLFRPGGFRLSEASLGRLKAVLSTIRPYADSFSLVFIGHSDQSPMSDAAKARVIDSNLSLSNMRAARAALAAIQSGFDPRYVSSQGVGEFARASRSLSIRIVERDESTGPKEQKK